MTRRILRNISAHYLGLFIGGLTQIILIPILVHYLGYDVYGILALCVSFTTLLQFLDFGICQATVKFIAEWKAQAADEKLKQLINAGLMLFLFFGFLAAFFVAFFAPHIPQWFHIPAQHRVEATNTFLWFAAGLLFFFPSIFLRSLLEGCQRYDFSNAVQTATYVLNAVASAVAAMSGYGIVAVALVGAASQFAQLLVLVFLTLRFFPKAISFRGINLKRMGGVWNLSFWNFIRSISARISWDLDTLIIGAFLSTSSVSPYVLGRKLPYLLSSLGWRWIEVFLPVSADLQARGKEETLQDLYLRASRLSLALSVPVALWLILLAGPTLRLWLGNVSSNMILVQQLVTISILFDLSHSVSATLLAGAGKLKRVSQFFLLDALLNLFLSLILVRRYGIIGVALGTTVSTVLIVTFFQIPYASRAFEVPLKRFFGEVILPQIVPAFCCVLLIFVFQEFIAIDHFFPWIMISFLALGSYALTFWFGSLSLLERRTLTGLLTGQKI